MCFIFYPLYHSLNFSIFQFSKPQFSFSIILNWLIMHDGCDLSCIWKRASQINWMKISENGQFEKKLYLQSSLGHSWSAQLSYYLEFLCKALFISDGTAKFTLLTTIHKVKVETKINASQSSILAKIYIHSCFL